MKNLGLEFQNPAVEDFIKKLSIATGEIDDNLRPAMQKLLQVTGSVSKSQELLKLALDVSAGSGVALNTVVSDLAAAQAGNNKGLKKYALGLTAAELKTIKFEDVTDKLGKTFAGSAAKGAETFSGQMKILTTAAGEAQETIGKGLVDAFKVLAGTKTGIEPITKAMADLSQEVSDTIVGLALFIKKIKDIPVAGKGFSLILENYIDILKRLRPELGLLIDAQEYLSNLAKRQTGTFQVGMSVTGATDFYDSQARAIAKAEADALAKKLAADKKAAAAKIKTDKIAAANKAKLDKAAAVFDIQKIQIAAALKGKISEEEKIRLLLMQAIEEGNAEKAEVLQKKLEKIQELNAKIAADILAIGETKDPFAAWADSLTTAVALLGSMPALIDDAGNLTPRGKKTIPPESEDILGIPSPTFTGSETIEEILAIVENAAADAADAADAAAVSVDETQAAVDALAEAALNGTAAETATGPSSIFNPYGTTPGSSAGAGIPYPSTNVYVTVEGSVLDGDDFSEIINRTMLNNIRRGFSQSVAGALP
jgi:hypothetical protein